MTWEISTGPEARFDCGQAAGYHRMGESLVYKGQVNLKGG
jgi:hypothetical protein